LNQFKLIPRRVTDWRGIDLSEQITSLGMNIHRQLP
jgi:hypothetical protein